MRLHGSSASSDWTKSQHGSAGRPPINFHPTIGALHGDEPAATIDLVSIPGGEMETLYAKDLKVLNNALNQPSAQPSTAVIPINEYVADPGESGPVCDNTREGRLLLPVVHGVRPRSSD
jgi:hypothetical protein